MDDRDDIDLADDPPKKRKYRVQKLPIKGGSVLRGAVLSNEHKHTPEWVQEDGEIEA